MKLQQTGGSNKMKTPDQYHVFATREQWRAWLVEHHASSKEAWLLHYRKRATAQTLSFPEAVEEALCFGWIDGLLKSIDEEKFALRYSPRRPHSIWAEHNKQRAERLIAEGRMTPAGLAKIAEAKASGEWDAATARENVDAIPADLEEELINHDSLASFQQWPPSRKKQYLYWLSTARRPETRRQRIEATAAAAAAGQ
jgi:uncharacterized protein YdeI (YjbR/CyaY-like superfamily)